MSNSFYITTPIYYVNDLPHIGHAYTSVAADVMARYHRMKGEEVYFLTGTDEHGQKVAQSAEKQNISPQEFTDFYSQKFRDLSRELNLSHDDFIRTTEERHIIAAQALWEKLKATGNIYLGSYSGWYSVRDEAFYQESELIDGKAPTGAPVEWVEEPSYFFALSKWEDKLLELYEQNQDFIWPKSRRNEVISFVKSGLKDLSISRTSFKWGVPIPGDERHVMYVWLDALTNYISALGFPNEQSDLYKKFWPGIHLVGKDILRFHAVYWPAFLMAANLPVPKQIIAHGWWTNEGQKISKSLGNVINPYDLIKEYGLDQFRYFMLREVPFGNDGNYSKDNATRRLNSELANNIGNLLQRVVSFIHKNCDSLLPQPINKNDPIFAEVENYIKQYFTAMDGYEFSEALEAVVRIGNLANIYIDEQAPWNLKKSNLEQMGHCLYILVNILKKIAILLNPFMPILSKKMQDVWGEHCSHFNELALFLNPGLKLNNLSIVFPRLDS